MEQFPPLEEEAEVAQTQGLGPALTGNFKVLA